MKTQDAAIREILRPAVYFVIENSFAMGLPDAQTNALINAGLDLLASVLNKRGLNLLSLECKAIAATAKMRLAASKEAIS